MLPGKRDSLQFGQECFMGKENDIRSSDERTSGCKIILKKGGNAGSGPLPFPDHILFSKRRFLNILSLLILVKVRRKIHDTCFRSLILEITALLANLPVANIDGDKQS